MKKLISIITPLYNEEENLPAFKSRLEDVFAKLPQYNFEVLLVDNGSCDSSQEWCTETARKNPDWRYLRFSRNFHSETSIAAGFHFARGDAAMVVFSDLQDPPEYIPQFLEKWNEGYDIVSGVVRDRQDANPFYKFASNFIYFLLHHLTSPKMPKGATDFKLLDRAVINALKSSEERIRFNRALINWLGYKNFYLTYDRKPRVKGKSYAGIWVRINLTINAITSFTPQPLRIIFFSGLFLLGASFTLILWNLINYFQGNPIPGYTTIYVLLLTCLAWQGLTIGFLGEYLTTVLMETKKRPRWIISNMENFEPDLVPDTVRKPRSNGNGPK